MRKTHILTHFSTQNHSNTLSKPSQILNQIFHQNSGVLSLILHLKNSIQALSLLQVYIKENPSLSYVGFNHWVISPMVSSLPFHENSIFFKLYYLLWIMIINYVRVLWNIDWKHVSTYFKLILWDGLSVVTMHVLSYETIIYYEIWLGSSSYLA